MDSNIIQPTGFVSYNIKCIQICHTHHTHSTQCENGIWFWWFKTPNHTCESVYCFGWRALPKLYKWMALALSNSIETFDGWCAGLHVSWYVCLYVCTTFGHCINLNIVNMSLKNVYSVRFDAFSVLNQSEGNVVGGRNSHWNESRNPFALFAWNIYFNLRRIKQWHTCTNRCGHIHKNRNMSFTCASENWVVNFTTKYQSSVYEYYISTDEIIML